jgi:hypothetical protein
MTKVSFTDNHAEPTKGYADARWHANPRLSPSSWRASQGFTVGKVAFDGRQSLEGLAAAMEVGCNLVVAGRMTLKDAAAMAERPAMLVAGFGAMDDYLEGADAWLWPVGPTTAVAEGFVTLERKVKDGELAFYGIALADGAADLGAWLERAGAAAEQVWGRKKRSALRLVMVPVNPLEMAAVHAGASTHKGESVSVLELAARLDLMVIADHALAWAGVDVRAVAADPTLAALDALARLGRAERAVAEKLGGWPAAQGVPVFGVLPALAAGQAPWPHSAAWTHWMGHVWPGVDAAWRAVPQTPEVEAYRAAWQVLLPHGAMLAAVAGARLAETLRGQFGEAVPRAWRKLSFRAQAWGAISSLPGVTAVLAELSHSDALPDLRAVMEHPDMVDVAAVFGNRPEGA